MESLHLLFLGSAGAAILGGLLRPGLDLKGYWRETLLLHLAGAVPAALLGWLIATAFRRPFRSRPRAAMLALGAGLGAAPWLGPLLPQEWLGLAVLPAAWLGRRWLQPLAARAGAGKGRWLSLLPLAALVGLLVLPSSADPRLPGGASRPAPACPDLILISIDTLRADALRDTREMTPNFGALRASAMWADYALSPSSQTTPAHATMLTGLGVFEHGVLDNSQDLPQSCTTLAERFREAGLRTAAVVSNGATSSRAGLDRGFDFFDESPIATSVGTFAKLSRYARKYTWLGWVGIVSNRDSAWQPFLFGRRLAPRNGDEGNGRHTTDNALLVLDQLYQDPSPFFFFLHFMDPHVPYAPPPEVRGRLAEPGGMPLTAGLEGVPEGDYRAVLRLCEQLASDSGPARRGLDYCHSLYLEEVLFLDRMLGRLLERIDGSGRETVLLLTGDHGEQFGEHGLAVHANSVYEPLLRVPFFLRGPGFRPGRLAGPPHLRDVVPTFLAAAGLDADPGLGGRDLARELAPRPHVAAQTSMLNQRGEDYPRHLAAARAGGWKLTVAFSREDPRLRPTPLELFDLALDPAELHNLHGERPEVAEQLMAHYLEAAAAWQGPAAADTSADRSEMLRELGYAGDH